MDRLKLGQPTEADMLEADDRELFVNAYIEYVVFRGPDDRYLPAIAYLRELEAARNAPWQPSPRLTKPETLKPYTGVPAGTR